MLINCFVHAQDRQGVQVQEAFKDQLVRLDPQDLQVIVVYQVVWVLKAGQDNQEILVFQE